MGLLDGLANGVSKAANGAADYYMKSLLQEETARIEFEKQARLDELKRSRDVEQADSMRKKQASDIEKEAGMISSSRKVAPDDVLAQGDAAAQAYANSDLPESEKAKGLIAASNYVNENSVADGKVTAEDRTNAAIKLGYISPKDAASLTDKEAKREMATAIAQGKWENALQIAQMKGDFAMTLGEMKAAAASGDGKATELMRNIAELKKMGKSDDEVIGLLLGSKVQEYTTTETERDNPDGSKTKTIQKVKAGNEAPSAGSKTKFILKDGKLVAVPAK